MRGRKKDFDFFAGITKSVTCVNAFLLTTWRVCRLFKKIECVLLADFFDREVSALIIIAEIMIVPCSDKRNASISICSRGLTSWIKGSL